MSIASAKKSGRGRPPVDSEAVNVRMERSLLQALDAFLMDQGPPPPSRPEVVRRVLAEHLRSQGYFVSADNDDLQK